MSKDYSVNKVENLAVRIRFSTATDPVQKVTTDGEEEIVEYYAAAQLLQCQSRTDAGIKIPVSLERKYYGTAKSEPWTAKQVGDAIKNFSTFNTVLYDDLKEIYINAINEDIS